MRIAALMPTCDRADVARRAADTFLTALSDLNRVASVTLVIADDSSQADESELLRRSVADLSIRHPEATIGVVKTSNRHRATIDAPGGGPGVARNAAMLALRGLCPDADVTIIFDDDVCFADTVYRGQQLRCDGRKLLQDALDLCEGGQVVVGCGYVGRQDLSILEHARLAGRIIVDQLVPPAIERRDVENVAPGGISTAFLAIATGPGDLPAFAPHYNEDYVWLHALQRAGWSLVRVPTQLIHAPPGDVQITSTGLSFQIHGEIVWLAVLERERFPAHAPADVAAAVQEITSDIRSAMADPRLKERPGIIEILAEVFAHYDALAREFSSGELGMQAKRLMRDIEQGLAM
jgi:hypothetical protein